MPGLSDAEMDALTDPLGLRLPPEARAWWGWHDFNRAGPRTFKARAMTGSGWGFARLEEAVSEAKERQQHDEAERRMWGPHVGRPYVSLWRETWLPFAAVDYGGLALLDCAFPNQQLSPIYYVKWPESDSESEPGTQSFGAPG